MKIYWNGEVIGEIRNNFYHWYPNADPEVVKSLTTNHP